MSDATAEVNRDAHEAEFKAMSRVFADVKPTTEVMKLLGTEIRKAPPT